MCSLDGPTESVTHPQQSCLVRLQTSKTRTVALVEQFALADVAVPHLDAVVAGVLHDVAFGCAAGRRYAAEGWRRGLSGMTAVAAAIRRCGI